MTDLSTPLAEPFANEPVELPIERPSDLPARVRVHTELGVAIYFTPSTRKFTARLSPVSGRGGGVDLSSLDFDAIVIKIRRRALLVPIQAYQITFDSLAIHDEDIVRVVPVTVIEHHAKRLEPFVIRYPETDSRTGRPFQRIRAVREVYLPRPEQVHHLRAAYVALREASRAYANQQAVLLDQAAAALASITRLDAAQVRHIQDGQAQSAAPPSEVGALLFDADDAPDEEEIQDESGDRQAAVADVADPRRAWE